MIVIHPMWNNCWGADLFVNLIGSGGVGVVVRANVLRVIEPMMDRGKDEWTVDVSEVFECFNYYHMLW